VLLVGLTGGIGAGKSTVARMLEERGAVVIDADRLARRAVEPGTHGYAEVLRRFGPDIVRLDGSLDRERLAHAVFDDVEARRALEGIVHPEVARLFAEAIESYRGTDRIVVYAVPLLVESGLQDAFDVVVTVEAPEDVRAGRLAADRGMSEEAARSRMGSQASDPERRAAADEVISNAGDLDALASEVDRMWRELQERSARPTARHPEKGMSP
jgi:dephospho-CoA kinase